MQENRDLLLSTFVIVGIPKDKNLYSEDIYIPKTRDMYRKKSQPKENRNL